MFKSFNMLAKVAKFLAVAIRDGAASFVLSYRGTRMKVTLTRKGRAKSGPGGVFESADAVFDVLVLVRNVFKEGGIRVGVVRYADMTFEVGVEMA